MTSQSKTLGGGGLAASYAGGYPPHLTDTSFVPTAGTASSFHINRDQFRLPGFLGGPDWIQPPTVVAQALYYFNASATIAWQYAVGDFGVTPDAWVGFWLDEDTELLYVVTESGGAGAHTIYTSTVDVNGTINNIGSTPSANPDTNINWFTFVQGLGVFPFLDGSGHYVVITSSNSGVYRTIIDSATGAIVSEGLLTSNDAAGQFYPPDKNGRVLMTEPNNGLSSFFNAGFGSDFVSSQPDWAILSLSGGDLSGVTGSLKKQWVVWGNSMWNVNKDNLDSSVRRVFTLDDLNEANNRLTKAFRSVDL